jgi:hypothetical protein
VSAPGLLSVGQAVTQPLAAPPQPCAPRRRAPSRPRALPARAQKTAEADEPELYAASALTRLLGPSLNRHAKLLMIATVSADARDLAQSAETLAFASEIKEIKTDARPSRSGSGGAAAPSQPRRLGLGGALAPSTAELAAPLAAARRAPRPLPPTPPPPRAATSGAADASGDRLRHEQQS